MRIALAALALLATAPLSAQMPAPAPAMAQRGGYPAAVTVRTRASGAFYADPAGKTLYVLDMRIARARTGETKDFCIGSCAAAWAAFAAPADAAPVGVWTVAAGAQGPQWSYRGNLVFTWRGDAKPGDTGGDGQDDIFSLIVHVPPAPTLVAPASVRALFVQQHYVLADPAGHTLFVAGAGGCGTACREWTPLAAGSAARDVGDWSVLRGDDAPQWAYRGAPVYVAVDDLPAAASVLAP